MTGGLGLEGAYGATIERIKAQGGDKSRLGMAALMWISHAERPLSANEFCHALAIELGSPDFNADAVPSMSTLVSCCQGLITVDEESSAVRLIHFTLQEYISTTPDIFSTPHSTMAEICLTYLNSEQAKAIPANSSLYILNMPFLKYCSLYWGVHAKRELSDHARLLSLELLSEYDGHISGELLLAEHYLDQPRYQNPNRSPQFNGLHCALFFEIADLVAALIEIECCDINDRDPLGYSPLGLAARNGYEEVVKILLAREEVNPGEPDKFGRAPLLHAASNGHEGLVKILLAREDVYPDEPDNGGLTPLSYSAQNGHEEVVKILLGRKEVNPDRPDYFSQAPLLHAASNGHEGVVKILLARADVNPDKPDNFGQAPLLHAASNGHEGVVKILLAREDVNPDKPDNGGLTPLMSAAQNGHEGVVKILLGRKEVNPDNRDNDGKTPLLLAAWYGHEGVVKLLLDVKRPTPTSEIMTAKHRPGMLPRAGASGL